VRTPLSPARAKAASTLVSTRLGDPFEVSIPDGNSEKFALFPAMGDFDGDGRTDLMVGTRKGEMRIYRGIGAGGRLRFAPAVSFEEFCPEGRIPTG
jgi:hypothetical protein